MLHLFSSPTSCSAGGSEATGHRIKPKAGQASWGSVPGSPMQPVKDGGFEMNAQAAAASQTPVPLHTQRCCATATAAQQPLHPTRTFHEAKGPLSFHTRRPTSILKLLALTYFVYALDFAAQNTSSYVIPASRRLHLLAHMPNAAVWTLSSTSFNVCSV
jgi:hypothetical protein